MKLLDLFSGAGGCAKGYQQAGYYVVGVDNEPQPHYCGDEFHQADAFEYLAEHWQEYDAIHGSPVCKGYTVMHNLPWLRDKVYPLQILPLRESLTAIGKPYVIENVMGARWGAKGLAKRGLEAHGMQAGWLCGRMFGLPFYRHRLFETNWLWLAPEHPKHQLNLHPRSERFVYGGTVKGLSGGAAVLDVKPRRGGPLPHNTIETVTRTGTTEPGYGLSQWQKGAQAAGIGVGHAKGWRLAAEAMGVDWMNRAELTQAIPPAYTFFIATQLQNILL